MAEVKPPQSTANIPSGPTGLPTNPEAPAKHEPLHVAPIVLPLAPAAPDQGLIPASTIRIFEAPVQAATIPAAPTLEETFSQGVDQFLVTLQAKGKETPFKVAIPEAGITLHYVPGDISQGTYIAGNGTALWKAKPAIDFEVNDLENLPKSVSDWVVEKTRLHELFSEKVKPLVKTDFNFNLEIRAILPPAFTEYLRMAHAALWAHFDFVRIQANRTLPEIIQMNPNAPEFAPYLRQIDTVYKTAKEVEAFNTKFGQIVTDGKYRKDPLALDVATSIHDVRSELNTALLIRDRIALMAKKNQDIKIQTKQITISPIIAHVLEASASAAAKKVDENNVAIETGIPEEMRQIQVNDAEDIRALRRALFNLSTNGVKYVDETRPEGRKMVQSVTRLADSIHFETVDNGIGMGAVDVSSAGTEGHRAMTVREKFQGTGLGLMNTLNMLHQLGAYSIQLTSRLNTGTRVSFALPLDRFKNTADGQPLASTTDSEGNLEAHRNAALRALENHFNLIKAEPAASHRTILRGGISLFFNPEPAHPAVELNITVPRGVNHTLEQLMDPHTPMTHEEASKAFNRLADWDSSVRQICELVAGHFKELTPHLPEARLVANLPDEIPNESQHEIRRSMGLTPADSESGDLIPAENIAPSKKAPNVDPDIALLTAVAERKRPRPATPSPAAQVHRASTSISTPPPLRRPTPPASEPVVQNAPTVEPTSATLPKENHAPKKPFAHTALGMGVSTLSNGVSMGLGSIIGTEIERRMEGGWRPFSWQETKHSLLISAPTGILAGAGIRALGNSVTGTLIRTGARASVMTGAHMAGRLLGPAAILFSAMHLEDYFSDGHIDSTLGQSLQQGAMIQGISLSTRSLFLYGPRLLLGIRAGLRGAKLATSVLKGPMGFAGILLHEVAFQALDRTVMELIKRNSRMEGMIAYQNQLKSGMADLVLLQKAKAPASTLQAKVEEIKSAAASWKHWEENILPYEKLDAEASLKLKHLEGKNGAFADMQRLSINLNLAREKETIRKSFIARPVKEATNFNQLNLVGSSFKKTLMAALPDFSGDSRNLQSEVNGFLKIQGLPPQTLPVLA